MINTELIAKVHQFNIVQTYAALQTRPAGLSRLEVEERSRIYGKNTIREVKGKPLYVRFLANFVHVMAILLWVGGGMAFVAQMPNLGIAVWMVNLINGIFSFWQEFRAEKATQALRQLLPQRAHVLRDGTEQEIPLDELVPGDVVLLAEGDRISADGRLVEASGLRVDQSTLTGEAHPVRKACDEVAQTQLNRSEIANLVFAGTTVSVGNGKAVVFATGMQTEFGKIAHLTQSVGEELSPLQKEIQSVTKSVTLIALVIGAVFFVLALAFARISLAASFVFAIGMIVAFVPEGLLPTVTLALAMGTQRMAHCHALIKRLSAVETLGCTTVICTDKTGTLTQNEMTVRALWLGGKKFSVTGAGYSPAGTIQNGHGPISIEPQSVDGTSVDLRELLIAAGLCNNARLTAPAGDSTRWTILGDPTEAALQVLACKGGVDLNVQARQTPRVRELPFDSHRKRMSTIHAVQDAEQAGLTLLRTIDAPAANFSGHVAYVKGAPKEVLDLCTYVRINGDCLPLTSEWREQVMQANDRFAGNGLRVLAVAERLLPAGLAESQPENVEENLVLIGLVAMMDPPRPEVATAVQKCRRADIRIVMITGDYGLTAESIARRVGIVRTSQPRIVTGVELEAMDDAALQEALKGEVIFARATPEHKLRVVSALQQMGQVVAVTGDGVNDAPALKKADIGVAMGLSGTDVAKEASDMILTDDNFASIVNAIEEGRAVYANIKKFTTYIFTSNMPEAVPFILFALSQGRIPLALNVMHVLSVDLGTDIVPALALGAEPPEPGIMERPPRNLNEHVVTVPLLLRSYAWLGPVEGLAAMAAFYFQYWTNGYAGQWVDLPSTGSLYASATAMALAAVVVTQIANLFVQRSEHTSLLKASVSRWLSNRLIWVGIGTELLIVLAIVYVPLLQNAIGTASFNPLNWLFLFAWLPALPLVDELRKVIAKGLTKTHKTHVRAEIAIDK